MKDIEFRAKSKESKEWIYGYLVKGETGNYYICKNLGHAFIWVDEKTIGQYTGLKDKNGTKIFEGDILKYQNGDFSALDKVVYNEEYGTFEVKFENEENEVLGFYLSNLDENTKYEVIGNIYDESDVK